MQAASGTFENRASDCLQGQLPSPTPSPIRVFHSPLCRHGGHGKPSPSTACCMQGLLGLVMRREWQGPALLPPPRLEQPCSQNTSSPVCSRGGGREQSSPEEGLGLHSFLGSRGVQAQAKPSSCPQRGVTLCVRTAAVRHGPQALSSGEFVQKPGLQANSEGPA